MVLFLRRRTHRHRVDNMKIYHDGDFKGVAGQPPESGVRLLDRIKIPFPRIIIFISSSLPIVSISFSLFVRPTIVSMKKALRNPAAEAK